MTSRTSRRDVFFVVCRVLCGKVDGATSSEGFLVVVVVDVVVAT